MIRINQMKLNIEHTSDDFETQRFLKNTFALKKRGTSGLSNPQTVDRCQQKKPVLYYVYSVDVQVRDEAKVKENGLKIIRYSSRLNQTDTISK